METKEKALVWLRNTLNAYAQNGVSKVRKCDLAPHLKFSYSSTDSAEVLEIELNWEEIVAELSLLENKQIIHLLKNPIEASDDDICVELKSFLSGTPFPDGWIRD